MIVFVMMAVGLNIVVGYAGLLDLGYVAFYAIGAYTAGWFASSQFAGQKCPKPGFGIDNCPVAVVPKHNFNLGGVGIPVGTGGFHFSIFLVLLIAGVITALFGIVIGLPTLRLRGDYLAIVTLGFGEILPQIARNGDNLGGFNLTNGANGITPIDTPGFGNHLSGWTGHFLPSNYLTCCSLDAESRPHPSPGHGGRPLLLDGARAARDHGLLLAAPARLAPRPGLGRDPRGRDRRGRDGRPADADEDVGLRERRVLRRRRRRLLRLPEERHLPRRLLLQHLGLRPLHGHPRRDGERLGRDRRRGASSPT